MAAHPAIASPVLKRLGGVIAALMLAAGCAQQETRTLPAATTTPAPVATGPAATAATESPPVPTPSQAYTPAPTATGEPPAIGQAWERLPDAPLALTEVAGAGHAGEGWFAGGFDGQGRPVDAVLIFDPAAGAWRAGPRLPEPIHHSALISTGHELYLLGGFRGTGFGSPVADVRRLAPDGQGWLAGPSLPAPRAAGAATWDGARIVYGGGVGPDGLAGTIYVLEGDAWRELGALPQPREHFAAASDSAGTTWFMGGRTAGVATNVGTVEMLRGDVVEPLGERLTPRSGVAAFWTPATGPCLAGGEGPGGTFAEVECVSPHGSVHALPLLSMARHGLGAAFLGDGVVMALGGPEPGLFVSPATERLEVRR